MLFSGTQGKKKVSLGGRSRVEETRQQVLQRTHLEREHRARQRREQKSATAIQTYTSLRSGSSGSRSSKTLAPQAHWRGRSLVAKLRELAREEWITQYGAAGEGLSSGPADADSTQVLRGLCFYCRVQDPQDVIRLAAAGRYVLSQAAPSAAAASQPQRIAVVVRLKRLLLLSLQALRAYRQDLWRDAASSLEKSQQSVTATLLNVLVVLTDPEYWRQHLDLQSAHQMAATLLHHLARNRLFASLADILSASPSTPCTLDEGNLERASAAVATMQPDSSHLSIVRQLAAVAGRYVSLQGKTAQQPVVLQLFCLPLVWSRCIPLLQHALPLWRQAVVELEGMGSIQALVQWLPSDQAGGKAGPAAAMLGNLAEVAGSVLKAAERRTGEQMALGFAQAAQLLLRVIPMRSLFPAAFDESIDDDAQAVSTSQPATDALPWSGSQPLPAALPQQIKRLASGGTIGPLTRLLLPYADSSAGTLTASEAAAMGRRANALCQMQRIMLESRALNHDTLIALAVTADLVPRLWWSYLKITLGAPGSYVDDEDFQLLQKPFPGLPGGAALLKISHANALGGEAWVPSGDEACDPGWMAPLVLLCSGFSMFLATSDDQDMYQRGRPLPFAQLHSPGGGGLLGLLKSALWQVLWVEKSPGQGSWSPAASKLRADMRDAVGKLLGQLYDRNCHRAFVPTEAFHIDNLPPERFHAEVNAAAAARGGLMEASHTRVWLILRHAPFLIPFQERAWVFQRVVSMDRKEHRSIPAMFGGQREIVIHRDRLFEDGFAQLNRLREELKDRVRIQFIDVYGIAEAGVDGGGLFKDFMENLVKEGFDPQNGLFLATSDNRLYPNPNAQLATSDAIPSFEFLGRMVGKALYEGIIVELPLAPFFLKKLLRRGLDVNDLPTLDAELYRSLMLLREYEGDAEDLSLTFTLTEDHLGEIKEVELVPNGRDRPVTNANKVEYVHRVANHRLNVQIRAATSAFRHGLEDIIERDWLAMFNEEELQMLIRGRGLAGLDIRELQENVHYAGGYDARHPVILAFWEALSSFTAQQQAAWLKFVTACSRAPLLGFKYLEPQLCIAKAGSEGDPSAQDRLPTSATCMNLLKLPPIQSPKQIAAKLLYAIENVSGFDLS